MPSFDAVIEPDLVELRNAVERAMLLTESAELSEAQFAMLISGDAELSAGLGLPVGGINLEELERSLVVQALERSGWNQTKAATLLGLNRDQIRYRIEKFKLEKGREAKFRYPVRVVSAGEFVLPGPSVEGMYHPALRARRIPGRIVVRP